MKVGKSTTPLDKCESLSSNNLRCHLEAFPVDAKLLMSAQKNMVKELPTNKGTLPCNLFFNSSGNKILLMATAEQSKENKAKALLLAIVGCQ